MGYKEESKVDKAGCNKRSKKFETLLNCKKNMLKTQLVNNLNKEQLVNNLNLNKEFLTELTKVSFLKLIFCKTKCNSQFAKTLLSV